MVHGASHWRAVDFISDLHLSEQTPSTFAAWARYLEQTPADAVWILGDLFEVWVGDDAALTTALTQLQTPDSFERRCADILRQAAQRLHLSFLPGNRDFLVGDALLQHCGMHRLAEPTVLQIWNRRILASHGDAWCLEDEEYQAFRRQVRSPAWQEEFLSKPLAQRKAIARDIRQTSEARKQGRPDPSLWADVDTGEALKWMNLCQTTDLVHGHTHRPGTHLLSSDRTRHVLSDWDLESPRPRAEVLRLSPDGWQRQPLS